MGQWERMETPGTNPRTYGQSLTEEVRIYNGKKTVSIPSGGGEAEEPQIITEIRRHPHSYHPPQKRRKSKWLEDLNRKTPHHKLLEKNKGKPHWQKSSHCFLTSSSQGKTKIKRDLVKLKAFEQ